MHDPAPSEDSFPTFPERVLELTGFRLGSVLALGAVLLVPVIGIAFTKFYAEAKVDRSSSNSGIVKSQEPTDEAKLRNVSQMPGNFLKLPLVDQLDLINSRIEIGEALAKSDSELADQSTEQLVSLYGLRCSLEESEGIAPEQTYHRMAELRQEALAAGNKERTASLDFLRALAATSRLNRSAEQSDFRFATDAILNLDINDLVNINRAKKLFTETIKLLENSPDKDSAKVFMSVVSDKLNESPEIEISNVGRSLMDYPSYAPYFRATTEPQDLSRESKRKFYNEMFEVIDKSPPHAAATYRMIVRLVDRLVNRTDIESARLAIERLGKIASNVDPVVKLKIDESLQKIQTRVATLGSKVDLSGSAFDGSPLQLPNGKKTTLVFWLPNTAESQAHVENLVDSERFDQWETSVLLVTQGDFSEEQLRSLAKQVPNFTVVDNATSGRWITQYGIDHVPYEVSIDTEGVVTRLAAPSR